MKEKTPSHCTDGHCSEPCLPRTLLYLQWAWMENRLLQRQGNNLLERQGNWGTAGFTFVAFLPRFIGSFLVLKSPVPLLESIAPVQCIVHPASPEAGWEWGDFLGPEMLRIWLKASPVTQAPPLQTPPCPALWGFFRSCSIRASHRNLCIINLGLALNQGFKSLYKQ